MIRKPACVIICLVAALWTSGAPAQEVKQEMDATFKPVCIEVELSSTEVRPGGRTAMTLKFRNDGTGAAKVDYFVFTHLEFPEKSCGNIVVNSDHAPTTPTTAWAPGELVTDGAHVIELPADAVEGKYHLHVGVYSREQPGYPRLSDQYVAEIEVSRDAPETKPVPPKMDEADAAKRRAALDARLRDALVLENDQLEFRISRRTGAWALRDKSTGEVWHSDPEREGFGQVQLSKGERTVTRRVDSFADARQQGDKIVLTHRPDVEGRPPTLEFTIELLPGNQGLRFAYTQAPSPQSEIGNPQSAIRNGMWAVESVRLLDKSLWATDAEGGYLAVPHRLGIMVPASEGLPSVTTYRSYSNHLSYSMAMFGAVKNGSALLVHWEDPYTVLEVERSWPDLPLVPGHGMVSASLTLRKTARSFVVRPVGTGGYAEIAAAYRNVARERGFLRTWREKIEANPSVESILGAADFKPFVFSRIVPGTRWNQGTEERIGVGYTFDEAAQVAEHLRNEVGIQRAMFVLAGWIHRGYDNQHPDILPAAPECGGNDGLADCATRVKKLGYLLGLHDNYQDMYEDAPSWDESFIMKPPDGSLWPGGEWAGGQAYLTCSRKALELAQREQNLPAVKTLFGPTIYFIDTTFAAPPFECFDPQHPLSYGDDIRWKRRLSEYARETFGLFGSEEGQEWAVPCADYFEGLMAHRTQRGPSDIIIPLFEMVYGDCVNLYTHQGDRAAPGRPAYILDHILYAEMPVYQFGAHLYYQEESDVPVEPSVHSVRQTGPRRFEITYAWKVESALAKDYGCFVHFTGRGTGRPEGIVFQNDHAFVRPTSSWRAGETVLDGPHTVEIQEGVAGNFEILIGLLDENRRVPIAGLQRGHLRYCTGTLGVSGGTIEFSSDTEAVVREFCFARSEGEAARLNQTDRLIRNTYEVLSPLNLITAHTPMTGHEFLTPDRKVERTRFGDVEITVNYGEKPYRAANAVLPQYGFLVESPIFVAFHATEYGGVELSEPTMVAARSLDGKPLSESDDVKLYRAFGDDKVQIDGREFRF